MAAVLDRECSPEDLVRSLAVDDAAVAAAVEELLSSGMLLRRESVLAFRRDPLREAITAALERPVARDLRRRVAVLLRRKSAPTDLAPLLMKVAHYAPAEHERALVNEAFRPRRKFGHLVAARFQRGGHEDLAAMCPLGSSASLASLREFLANKLR